MAKKKKIVPPEIGGTESDNFKEISQYEISAYQLVTKQMEGAKSVVDNLKVKMKKWDDMAASRLDMTKTDARGNYINTDYRSRLCLPIVENALRSLLAKYVVSLLTRRPFFKLTPIGVMDDSTAKRIQNALVFMFDKMPNFIRNIITFLQEMLTYGTAVGKVTWRKIERNTKDGVVIEYEGAYFEPIHLENFFIDPDATGIDGYWKLHEYWTTKTALQLKNDNYKKLTGKDLYKNLDSVTSVYDRVDDGRYTIVSDKITRGINQPETNVTEYNKIRIWERWSEDNSRLIIIANKNIVLYDDVNPQDSGMHPFIYAVYEPVKFEFYGKGACEKVKDLHDELQHINNQICENVTLHNNPGYFSLPGALVQNQIASRPGGVSIVNGSKEDVWQKAFLPLGEQIFRLRDELIFKIEQALGTVAMSTANAQPVTKEQSATESAIQNRLGNEFHGFNLLILEIPGLIEVVKRAYMLLQQYAGEEYEYRISDTQGPGFLHQEDLMDVNFSPKIGLEVMSAEVGMSTVANMMAQLKDIPGFTAELLPVLKDYMGKVLGMHLSDAVGSPQPQQEQPSNNVPVASQAIPGVTTGIPGALQPEQMSMQTEGNQ